MRVEDKVAANGSFYNEHWRHSWKARFMYDPISKRKIAQYVLKQTGYEDGGKYVLDIGFGFGLILFTFDKTDYITGVELAQSAVDFARNKAKKRGFADAKFHLYTGIGKTSFPDDSYDLVICSHVIEHVPDDDFLLIEIRRVLRCGGIAFLNIPINEEHFDDPRHLRKYKPAQFVEKLQAQGFKLVYSYEGDRLWNTFGWFFEKDYHNKIPVLGFVISSVVNIFFSSWPFPIQQWFEATFLKHLKPRQFAVCVTKDTGERS